MLKDVINELGGRRIAQACNVTPGCVSIWKRKGHLPGRSTKIDWRGDRHEESIARLAGITVPELRKRIDQAQNA